MRVELTTYTPDGNWKTKRGCDSTGFASFVQRKDVIAVMNEVIQLGGRVELFTTQGGSTNGGSNHDRSI